MSMTEWEAVLALPVDPERDHILGSEDALRTLVEYGDYQCPFCKLAHGVVKTVRARLGDQVRYVFRHFPLTTIHPLAQQAAEAAEAAGAQGAFWEMHELLFAGQPRLELPDLVRYARGLGLDVDRFRDELQGHVNLARVREDFLSGVRSGVNGTPTFFIDDVRYNGPWEDPEALIEALLEVEPDIEV